MSKEMGSKTEDRTASKVVISYPEDLSKWGRYQVEKPSFVAYIRKVRGDKVEKGDRWEEFVGVGCCGSSLDVPLVVEDIEGGDAIGNDTEIIFTAREECEIEGGWKIQSGQEPS